MRKKVISLNDNEFVSSCKKLGEDVRMHFLPDVIIGVLTGGGEVGRNILPIIKEVNKGVKYQDIKVQRKSTNVKRKFDVKNILKGFPTIILDLLRILENDFDEIKSKFITPKRIGDVVFNEDVRKVLQEGNVKVLIVDDAIDTGATVKLIIDSIKLINPNVLIKIAVITVSNNKPLVVPDFNLYKKVLVRFPWSLDA